MLSLVTEQLAGANVFLCEVENPYYAEDPLRKEEMHKRMHFYLRNGWRDAMVDARMFGVEYRLLAAPVGRQEDPRQTAEDYRKIYQDVVEPAVLEKNMTLRIAGQA